MKKYFKNKILISILLVVIMILSSCESIVNLHVLDDGSLWNKSKNIIYVPCSVSVKAYAIGDLYGKTNNLDIYEIQFESTDDFLSEKENLLGGIYRRSDLPEITVESFNAIAARIYITGETDYIIDEFASPPEYLTESLYENYEDGTPYTTAVVDAIASDDRVLVPQQIDEDYTFHIRLLSADYPGLTYTVIFMMDINGGCFLYDRAIQKCVDCPEIIKTRMLRTARQINETSESEASSVESEESI